jgi:hypothetical protein
LAEDDRQSKEVSCCNQDQGKTRSIEEIGTDGLAYALIAIVRAHLINGVKHYDQNMTLLETDKEIINYMSQHGDIYLDDSEVLQNTTPERQLELLRDEMLEAQKTVQIISKTN